MLALGRNKATRSVWFIWFIRLVWFNQTNQTDQMNKKGAVKGVGHED